MMDPTFVTTIDLHLAKRLEEDLRNQGFEIANPPYTIFSGRKKGVSCTLYQSGKLVVQGKEKHLFIQFYLEPEILGTFNYSYPSVTEEEIPFHAHIGIDESGKGDIFGPLSIAGVFADEAQISELKKLGVKDSKKLSDSTILKLAKKIRSSYLYHIVRIGPTKYNELYPRFGNLNHFLAWGHATAIEQLVLKSGCLVVTIDQFAAEHVVLQALKKKNLELTLTQRHRGEEDLVVAAASIVARADFVEGLEQLSQEIGIKLPKGAASHTVAIAREIATERGSSFLSHVAKVHFNPIQKIIYEKQ